MKNIWLIPGVYCIRNKKNEKCYVGSTKNLSGRINMHKRQLRLNIHINKHLQSSYNKYGIENFEFSVLIRCKEDDLIKQEERFTKLFNCFDRSFGYNKATDIKRCAGYKWNKSSRKKLSESKKGTKIHPNTLKALITANKKRIYKKRFKRSKYAIEKVAEGHKKEIYQYDFDGKFIKTWKSALDAGKILKVRPNSINSCARGKKLSAFGFQWKYYKKDNIGKRKSVQGGKPEFTKIEQFKNNKLINTFSSGKEASIKTNLNYKGIMGACKNEKPYKGFNWKYYIEP